MPSPPSEEKYLHLFARYLPYIVILVLARANYRLYLDARADASERIREKDRQEEFWRDAYIRTDRSYDKLIRYEKNKDSAVDHNGSIDTGSRR